ncbi:uncharacterized protein A1O9_12587 [Exophiala aquamarina CBS 119918]|uniref:FAD/NAD(P)-binding domain-containing protein n=1 Tax=Exophiala aquamarina CBS 119918 TaxID=1182545 RepID=A0A072NWL7_9EURO|nr:uncharacterized protein A1O9_12587 [Exophiala aquamarina CBS 119918]KEF51438.1 hypothetical protein A1O9_12587 [Exophiala aquamarina CBS 119918]
MLANGLDDVLPYSPRWSLENIVCTLPSTNFSTNVDYEAIAEPIVNALEHLSADQLAAEAIWRDLFALTGTTRTIYKPGSILKAWSETRHQRLGQGFRLVPTSSKEVRLPGGYGWVQVAFTFEMRSAPESTGYGFLSLVQEDGKWKIWILRTLLKQLKGHGNVDALMPAQGACETSTRLSMPSHQLHANPATTLNGHHLAVDSAGEHFDVVIVGAGQSGLSCAGRLECLGVRYVVLEQNAEVGDNWKMRYESARLHTIREYSQLPFDRTFSDPYPEFLGKDDLVKGYKEWVSKFGIDKNIRFSTTLESGTWNEAGNLYSLQVRQDGKLKTLSSRHVILAIGPGGQIPMQPKLPGANKFSGLILHSANYTSATSWKGKSGIVVGTANTAHDVAEDMVLAGLSSVTMFQRGKTYVLPAEYLATVAGRSYRKDVATSDADQEAQSLPNVVSRLLFDKSLNAQAALQPERFDALERAGFQVQRYGDLLWHINERFGGHYIDVGCSERISRGEIKMKSGVSLTQFANDGLGFSDGSVVPADVIIFCTGFLGDMRSEVARLFGQQVADRTRGFWGLDVEGEFNGAFRPSGPLQIKADLLGMPLTVYEGEQRSAQEKMTVISNGNHEASQ